jgi:hypothetical protein
MLKIGLQFNVIKNLLKILQNITPFTGILSSMLFLVLVF